MTDFLILYNIIYDILERFLTNIVLTYNLLLMTEIILLQKLPSMILQ